MKILGVFKALMKWNKDIKKQHARQGRIAEAQRQLRLARDLVSKSQSRGRDDEHHAVLVCVDLVSIIIRRCP